MRYRKIGLVLLMTFLILVAPVYAQRFSYTLEGERRLPSPLGYVYEGEISNLGLRAAEDLFLGPDGNMYIADTRNHRVIKFTREGELLQVFGKGEERLFSPQGVFVAEDGTVYVADTGNARIAIFAPDGSFIKELTRPESRILGEDFRFRPTKLVVDKRRFLYIINEGDYRGMLLFDEKGHFRGFFGSNRVGFSLRQLAIRLFASEEQKQRLAKELPPPHSNVTIDELGYLYSTTFYDRTNQIKRLSPAGVDVYNQGLTNFYGERGRRGWQVVYPSFVDLAVDEKGIISAVDSANGRVYQYNQDRNLLVVFGGKGEGKGEFSTPSSIVVDERGLLYVLDKDRNNIQIFRPTRYALLMHEASELYQDGRYEEADKPWREVVRLNGNSALAHSGIAKAAYKRGDWLEAMDHYRYAKNRTGYSRAFGELRHEYIGDNFPLVVFWLFVTVVLIRLFFRLLGYIASLPEDKVGLGLQTLKRAVMVLKRPGDGILDLKYQGTVSSALIVMVAVYIVRLISIRFAGFAISSTDPTEINPLMEAARVFIPWLVWSIANYGVSTINAGEGFFRNILVASAFSMVPYVLFGIPITLLSNIATVGEKAMFRFGWWVLGVWCAILLFNQVRLIHNFRFKKAVGITCLTLFGMTVFVGAVGLTFGLINQMVDFAEQVIVELSIR